MNTQTLKSLFEVEAIDGGAYAIHDGAQTVAIVSAQGYVDWLAVSPQAAGARVRTLAKEPHLGNVRGLLFRLHLPQLTEQMDTIRCEVVAQGRHVQLHATSHSADRRFLGRHQALLQVNRATKRYEWACQTSLTYLLPESVQLAGIEYNNLLPARVGGRLLHAATKRYSATLLVDRADTAWIFPHQHLLHYGEKIATLDFAPGAMAGFVGEALNPMVILDDSPLPPTWAICDAYYDLHCCARTPEPLAPNRAYTWRYRICYLEAATLAPVLQAARPIPLTPDDYAAHTAPRLELGMNYLQDVVRIDAADEACGFRLAPPTKVWAPTMGPHGTGALCLHNDTPGQTVWTASLGTQAPAGACVRLRAQVQSEGVTGQGVYLRLRPLTFDWHPTPHVDHWPSLVSPALTGTTAGWTRIETPELRVPVDVEDCELEIELVLEGTGRARVGEIELTC